MFVIDHPAEFKSGVRVFFEVERPKDGFEKNFIRRHVSQSEEEFDEKLNELVAQAREGGRIYCSVEPRDVRKAMRTFKEWQLANDYVSEPEHFYFQAERRWRKALMQDNISERDKRRWLIDCDTEQEYAFAAANLDEFYSNSYRYEYTTKSGKHVIIEPFNLTKCSPEFRNMIRRNSVMLWAY